MILIVEPTTEKQKILLIDRDQHGFISELKKRIGSFDNDIFSSPFLPDRIIIYNYIYIVNPTASELDILTTQGKPVVILLINQQKQLKSLQKRLDAIHASHIKIINISGTGTLSSEQIESIIWFALSNKQDRVLNVQTLVSNKKNGMVGLKKTQAPPMYNRVSIFGPLFSLRAVPFIIIAIIIFIHTLFIPPLLIANYFFYKNISLLGTANASYVTKNLELGNTYLSFSKRIYGVVRPTYLFLLVASYPDTVFVLDQTFYSIMRKSASTQTNAYELVALLFNKSKTDKQRARIDYLLKEETTNLEDIHQQLTYMSSLIPNWMYKKNTIQTTIDQINSSIKTTAQLLPHAPVVLAKDTEKKYLILFTDNMQLRPGGGLISAYGIATFKNYTYEGLEVFDVYDADGKLTIEQKQSNPILQLLKQKRLYIHDAALSPDFPENYKSIKELLTEAVNIRNFDGGFVVTGTTIKYLLEATGPLDIPDFNETLTPDNFYLKSEMYGSTQFFPGSIQKKSFLSTVANQMLLSFEQAPLSSVFASIQKSLTEKQIVVYFEDDPTNKTIDSLYWSGRLYPPICTRAAINCIVNYIFPVEANVGENRINQYIKKSYFQRTTISDSGTVKNRFTEKITNESRPDTPIGGTYKVLLQILLPANITIKTITKNDTSVDGYKIIKGTHTQIEFYVEVPPSKTLEIALTYELEQKIVKGKNLYQLMVQKQIGGQNTDLDLIIQLPKDISIVNQNYAALVKDRSIIYNTIVSSDKIFVTELLKE